MNPLLLLAHDLCEGGEAACDRVIGLLRAAGPGRWNVRVVHVIDQRMLDAITSTAVSGTGEVPQVARRAADEALDRVAERLRRESAAEVERCALVGHPARELLAEVQRSQPALMVAGTGNQMWRQVLLGSTVRPLLRGVAAPVWLVRSRHGQPVQRVLLGSDLQASAAAALRLAADLLPDASFDLLHVIAGGEALPVGVPDSPPLREAREQQRGAAIAELQRQARDFLPGRTVRCDARAGHPVACLLEALKDRQPDLLVLGRHGRGASEAQRLGSVAEALADLASCDLLCAPA